MLLVSERARKGSLQDCRVASKTNFRSNQMWFKLKVGMDNQDNWYAWNAYLCGTRKGCMVADCMFQSLQATLMSLAYYKHNNRSKYEA